MYGIWLLLLQNLFWFWFGFFVLIISTFVGYLIPKISFYLTHNKGDKKVYTFPNGISPKVNVIVQLEFELTYDDVAVQHDSH